MRSKRIPAGFVRLRSVPTCCKEIGEQSVGRGAADHVVSEVNVGWWRPGQRRRSPKDNPVGIPDTHGRCPRGTSCSDPDRRDVCADADINQGRFSPLELLDPSATAWSDSEFGGRWRQVPPHRILASASAADGSLAS